MENAFFPATFQGKYSFCFPEFTFADTHIGAPYDVCFLGVEFRINRSIFSARPSDYHNNLQSYLDTLLPPL